MNPQINTINESVKINGNICPPCMMLIIISPTVVRIAFTQAIRDCALNITQNPLPIFLATIVHSS